MKLRLETGKFKRVFEKKFAPHPSSGLFTLNFYLLDFLVDYLERLESLSLMDAGLLQQCTALVRRSYRITSRRLSTGMHEPVENMSSALDSLQRSRSKVHEGGSGPSVSKKRMCVEGSGDYVVCDGVWLFLGQVSKGAESVGAAVPLEGSLCVVLGWLLRELWRAPFVNCVK